MRRSSWRKKDSRAHYSELGLWKSGGVGGGGRSGQLGRPPTAPPHAIIKQPSVLGLSPEAIWWRTGGGESGSGDCLGCFCLLFRFGFGCLSRRDGAYSAT